MENHTEKNMESEMETWLAPTKSVHQLDRSTNGLGYIGIYPASWRTMLFRSAQIHGACERAVRQSSTSGMWDAAKNRFELDSRHSLGVLHNLSIPFWGSPESILGSILGFPSYGSVSHLQSPMSKREDLYQFAIC